MQHITSLAAAPREPLCLAFGSFDGLHAGHRAVLARLLARPGHPTLLLSFSGSPAPFFYTEAEKALLLRDSGLGTLLSLPAAEMEALGAEAFARDILAGALHARRVVIGADMRFGREGLGAAALAAFGKQYGFSVETVPTVKMHGLPVSKEAIRQAAAAGDYAAMLALLGRPYLLAGQVVHGKAAGHKHGLPTANLSLTPGKLLPPYGVYATLAHLEAGTYWGVTNIGLRPSDDDIPLPTVETLLLDFQGDIYGQPLALEVCMYIRGIRKFQGGLDEVRKQVDQDSLQVRAYMESHPSLARSLAPGKK